MQKRKLGNSDLEITPLGIGAWAMGGSGWAFAWGPQDDQESIAAIHAALDRGINWIDTAAVYGLGHSEEVVARALEGLSTKPYIFTKCERVWNERGEIAKSLKESSIRKEVEASLRRLNVDVIDLYQIHWPEPDEDIEEGWTAMAKLKQEGKVRHIGVSNFNADQMKRAQAIAPITSLAAALLADFAGNRGLRFCPMRRRTTSAYIVYSPMKSGLLSGAMTRERVAAFPADDFRTARAQLPGTAAFAESRIGRTAARHREAPRPHARRSRDRLDATASGCHRRNCRNALGRTKWTA